MFLAPLLAIAGMSATWKAATDMWAGASHLLVWDGVLLLPMLAMLGLLLFAALRPERRWPFWIALLGNASICGFLVWVAFFFDFPVLM